MQFELDHEQALKIDRKRFSREVAQLVEQIRPDPTLPELANIKTNAEAQVRYYMECLNNADPDDVAWLDKRVADYTAERDRAEAEIAARGGIPEVLERPKPAAAPQQPYAESVARPVEEPSCVPGRPRQAQNLHPEVELFLGRVTAFAKAPGNIYPKPRRRITILDFARYPASPMILYLVRGAEATRSDAGWGTFTDLRKRSSYLRANFS